MAGLRTFDRLLFQTSRLCRKRDLQSARCFSTNNQAAPFSRSKNVLNLENQNLKLQYGGELRDIKITWEQWGDSTLDGKRTIFIMPSFSHSSHVASNLDDPRPGWWQSIVGPGKFLDTDYFRMISASVLGAPYGTTGPMDIDPETGKPYNKAFPQISPADMATVHSLLLDHLGLDSVHAVIGGSLGGMQAVQFGALFPDRCDRLVLISCTAKTTPGTVAMRFLQRQAILNDPHYQDGEYTLERRPADGMHRARELGMILYRSREEFDARFEWNPVGPTHFAHVTFEVESYLAYQAQKFSKVYDPNCYLLLSKAMDLQDVGHGQPTLAGGLSRIQAKTLVIGVNQDHLVPPSEQRQIVDVLKSEGRDAQLVLIDSHYGHDAMFVESMQRQTFGPLIKKFVEDGLEEKLVSERFRYSSL